MVLIMKKTNNKKGEYNLHKRMVSVILLLLVTAFALSACKRNPNNNSSLNDNTGTAGNSFSEDADSSIINSTDCNADSEISKNASKFTDSQAASAGKATVDSIFLSGKPFEDFDKKIYEYSVVLDEMAESPPKVTALKTNGDGEIKIVQATGVNGKATVSLNGIIYSIHFKQKDISNMLNNSYYKLKVKNKLNIAYFGGSITAGAGANGKIYSWAYRTTDWFKANFPNAVIRDNNAAIGGTGTIFGVYRVIEDLKLESDTDRPDLVFIEFAINDIIDQTKTENSKNYLETIINIIYDYVPDADIMVLFTTDQSQMAKDFEMRRAHKAVADAYKLPTVAIGELLANDLLAEGGGTYTQKLWDKYFADAVHPSRNGHAKYAGYITRYINLAFSTKSSVPNGITNSYRSASLFGKLLQNPHTVTLKGQTAPAGFTIDQAGAIISNGGTNKSFTVNFKGTDLEIWIRGEESGGVLETVVDGNPIGNVELYSSPNERIKTVVRNLSDDTHSVTFTLKNSGKGDYMKIERFCIAGSDLYSKIKLIY